MKRFLPSALFLRFTAVLALLAAPCATAQQNQTAPFQGRVLLKEGNGVVPMTSGRVGASDEQGRMYESTAIRWDGTYELNLRINQRSVIQVLVRDYIFEPARIVFFAERNRGIPDFVASTRGQGRLEVTTRLHERSQARVNLDDQRFTVTDADTGRLISTFRLDRQGRFRVNAPEGTKLLIEPKPNRNLQWIPPQLTTTVSRGDQTAQLVYLPSSEVGTGNLNLSKDHEENPRVIDVKLQSVDLNRGKYVVGDEVELRARPGRGVPDDARYTFLVRYDNERNFRTLANLQPGTSIRFTLERPGGFESKVALFARGVQLGGATIRNYAVASPNDNAPGVKHHDPRAPLPFLVDDFPQGWHMDLRFSIDQVAGPVRQPRHLKLDAWVKQDLESRRVPREGRRLTFLVRHEDDNQWTIVQNNVPTLEWSWTPPRQGRWTLRVDYVKPEERRDPNRHYSHDVNGRAQISFTATGPSTVHSSSSGLTAETPPAPRPGFRPLATPTQTPHPTVRPVPKATPKATPRPILRPINTPKPQTTPRPILRPLNRPTPKPSTP